MPLVRGMLRMFIDVLATLLGLLTQWRNQLKLRLYLVRSGAGLVAIPYLVIFLEDRDWAIKRCLNLGHQVCLAERRVAAQFRTELDYAR